MVFLPGNHPVSGLACGISTLLWRERSNQGLHTRPLGGGRGGTPWGGACQQIPHIDSDISLKKGRGGGGKGFRVLHCLYKVSKFLTFMYSVFQNHLFFQGIQDFLFLDSRFISSLMRNYRVSDRYILQVRFSMLVVPCYTAQHRKLQFPG